MDETQIKEPGDRGENTPATSDEIEIKEAEMTKARQSSEHSIKEAHTKKGKKPKSKKSKEKTKPAESDSESSSSSDDSDSEKDDDSESSSSSSSSDSDDETDKQKKKRKLKAKKKAKQKAKDKKEKKEKKEKKKAKLKRKAKNVCNPDYSRKGNSLTRHSKQLILAPTLTPTPEILIPMRRMKMPTPVRLHKCSSFKSSSSFSNCVMSRRLLLLMAQA